MILHIGSSDSTAALQQEGPGFEGRPGVFQHLSNPASINGYRQRMENEDARMIQPVTQPEFIHRKNIHRQF